MAVAASTNKSTVFIFRRIEVASGQLWPHQHFKVVDGFIEVMEAMSRRREDTSFDY